MILTKEQLKCIEKIFIDRASMTRIPVNTHPRRQSPAEKRQVFELRRIGYKQYSLLPICGNCTPLVHGQFLFVILASDPGRILCGAPADSDAARHSPELRVEGHTSLSLRADVLFAGMLEFRMGELVRWTNDSGHYSPPANLRQKNLIPAVKLLLPEQLFSIGLDEHSSPGWSF